MSGSLGTWPISPAAKPAKPAPSSTRSSRLAAGTSFALGRAYMSTNCAKKNSMPRSSDRRSDLVEPRLVRRAIQSPPRRSGTILSPLPRGGDGRFLHGSRGGSCVGVAAPSACAQPDDLDGDLDHQPVLAREGRAGELPDPAQPLAERVRVDVSASAVALMLPRRRRNSSSVASSEVPRCRRSRRASPSRRRSRRARRPRARAGAGTCRRRAPRSAITAAPPQDRAPSSACCASSKPAAKLGAAADARDADCDAAAELRMDARAPRRPRSPPVPATRSSARSESSRRSNSEPGSAVASDRSRPSSAGLSDEHEMRRSRSQPRRAAFPRGRRSPPAGELLEEVLDQVLLGEPLDQLDLLDRRPRSGLRPRARDRPPCSPPRRAGRPARRRRRAARRAAPRDRRGASSGRAPRGRLARLASPAGADARTRAPRSPASSRWT